MIILWKYIVNFGRQLHRYIHIYIHWRHINVEFLKYYIQYIYFNEFKIAINVHWKSIELFVLKIIIIWIQDIENGYINCLLIQIIYLYNFITIFYGKFTTSISSHIYSVVLKLPYNNLTKIFLHVSVIHVKNNWNTVTYCDKLNNIKYKNTDFHKAHTIN